MADRAKALVEKLKGKAPEYSSGTNIEINGQVDPDLPIVTMYLTFFDPPILFRNLVASDIG